MPKVACRRRWQLFAAVALLLITCPMRAQSQGDVHLLQGIAVGGARCLSVSPDGQYLVVGTSVGTALIFETESWQAVATLTGHTSEIRAVAFDRTGRIVATGSEDSLVKLWEVPLGRFVRTIAALRSVRDLSFSPTSSSLAVGSTAGVEVFDASSGAYLTKISDARGSTIVFSPNGSLLAGELRGRSGIGLWDIVSWGRVGRLREGREISDIAFSPDGQFIASCEYDDSWVSVHNVSTQTLVINIDAGHTSSLAYSPDGRLLATGSRTFPSSRPTPIKVWRSEEGRTELLALLEGHVYSVLAIAFDPAGEWLASCSSDNTLRVWRVPG